MDASDYDETMGIAPLFAVWPNRLDVFATVVFLVLIATIPLLGYVFMVADFRAYLKTLNRMLVRIREYLPHLPAWARHETPRALQIFGLKLPCTLEQLLVEYRQRVKKLHPDRGGDRQKFLLLQLHFEEAQKFLRELQEAEEHSKSSVGG